MNRNQENQFPFGPADVIAWAIGGSNDSSHLVPRVPYVLTNQVDTVTNHLQITRVVIENFLSITACDVRLERLTFLVGRNGSGKSNFLDALRFVSASLRHSIEHAVECRHGIHGVLTRHLDRPDHFGIRLDCQIGNATVQFGFRIGLVEDFDFGVRREECRVMFDDSTSEEHRYSVRDGRVSASFRNPPPASKNRLYLLTVSGFEEFRPVYNALSLMRFYNLRPEAMRGIQVPTSSTILKSDGGNIGRVISRIENGNPRFKRRIEDYLQNIVPDLTGISRKSDHTYSILEFQQQVPGSDQVVTFLAQSMSAGTLRALGVLVALFQCAGSTGPYLVGIEEPEDGIHPAAAEVLVDSMREASLHAQVIVTSHSADMLDQRGIPAESILAVVADSGGSRIGPLDDAGRSALENHLFTVGELMRIDQLQIAGAVAEQRPYCFDIFESMS